MQRQREKRSQKPKKPTFYTTAKGKDKEFVEKFTKDDASQKTASTYHSIFVKKYDKHKVLYRRNQSKHTYADSNNVPSSMYENLKKGIVLRGTAFLHNFGLYSSFGNQINKKQVIEVDEIRPKTVTKNSQAKKSLDDKILVHKTDVVKSIVTSFHENPAKLKTIIIDNNQIAAKYPCIIIRLNNGYNYHKDMIQKKVMNEYDEAYPKFLTHLLISSINKVLYEAEVGVFFDRRQSFGFLTPTASDVGSAIRLSLGLVPNQQWIRSVIKGIREFDALIHELWTQESIRLFDSTKEMGQPYNKFKSGNMDNYGHKLFLMSLLEIKEIENLPSMNNEKSIIKLIAELCTNYAKISTAVENGDYFSSLVEKLVKCSQLPADEKFNTLFSEIINVYYRLNKKDKNKFVEQHKSTFEKMETLEREIQDYQSRSVEEVSKLKQIDATSESPSHSQSISEDKSVEITSTKLVQNPILTNVNNGHDELSKSLSFEESSRLAKKQSLQSQNKYYTPTGMSSLSAPLFAYENLFSDIFPQPIRFKTEIYSYFELAGWSSRKLSKKRIHLTNSYDLADIVFVDNNPCVNEAQKPISVDVVIDKMKKPSVDRPKILIVDVTSSTQQQIEVITNKWMMSNIPLLCFAASGLKNHQLGLDMAQYGENRIFINYYYFSELSKENSKKAETFKQQCLKFTNKMRLLTKASSSVYSTYVRRDIREKARSSSEDSSDPLTYAGKEISNKHTHIQFEDEISNELEYTQLEVYSNSPSEKDKSTRDHITYVPLRETEEKEIVYYSQKYENEVYEFSAYDINENCLAEIKIAKKEESDKFIIERRFPKDLAHHIQKNLINIINKYFENSLELTEDDVALFGSQDICNGMSKKI